MKSARYYDDHTRHIEDKVESDNDGDIRTALIEHHRQSIGKKLELQLKRIKSLTAILEQLAISNSGNDKDDTRKKLNDIIKEAKISITIITENNIKSGREYASISQVSMLAESIMRTVGHSTPDRAIQPSLSVEPVKQIMADILETQKEIKELQYIVDDLIEEKDQKKIDSLRETIRATLDQIIMYANSLGYYPPPEDNSRYPASTAQFVEKLKARLDQDELCDIAELKRLHSICLNLLQTCLARASFQKLNESNPEFSEWLLTNGLRENFINSLAANINLIDLAQYPDSSIPARDINTIISLYRELHVLLEKNARLKSKQHRMLKLKQQYLSNLTEPGMLSAMASPGNKVSTLTQEIENLQNNRYPAASVNKWKSVFANHLSQLAELENQIDQTAKSIEQLSEEKEHEIAENMRSAVTQMDDTLQKFIDDKKKMLNPALGIAFEKAIDGLYHSNNPLSPHYEKKIIAIANKEAVFKQYTALSTIYDKILEYRRRNLDKISFFYSCAATKEKKNTANNLLKLIESGGNATQILELLANREDRNDTAFTNLQKHRFSLSKLLPWKKAAGHLLTDEIRAIASEALQQTTEQPELTHLPTRQMCG